MTKEELDTILNYCLNDAFKVQKLRNHPNSNNIAEFIIGWLKINSFDFDLTPTTEEVNKFLDDNYPTKTHYITTEEIDERIYLNDYPEEI